MIKLIPHNVLDDSTKATMLKALVEFVVDNKEPFELVEKKSFQLFCQSHNKYFKLPARRTLVRAIHGEYYAMRK